MVRWRNWYRALPRLIVAGSNPVLTTNNKINNKINNMTEEINKQINLLEQEQVRVKQFINENNFNCTTAPYVIAKQYRDDIKKHIKILKMNLEK